MLRIHQVSNHRSQSPAPVLRAPAHGFLQRKCACGGNAGFDDDCEDCQKKRLQRKLTIGASNDSLELEADRAADQVTSGPAHSGINASPPRVQRCVEQPNGQRDMAPPSVDQALAGPGRPLEPALRRDMEQRFGHDFSRVSVYSGQVAEQSARDVNAHAYTVGDNLVFNAGAYAPQTFAGRRLIAHELTHVIQQQKSGQTAVLRAPAHGGGRVTFTVTDSKSNDPNCAYQKGEVERANSSKGILDYDIEKAEFFSMDPPDATVVADFKIDDGELRPSTERLFRQYWMPRFDKRTLGSLEIVGFNDCVGWESRNRQLREQRAKSVARLLPGAAASAASIEQYLVPNTSERGRALNRAVIIRPKPNVPPPPPPPIPHEVTINKDEPPSKNCSAEQREQLAIAFPAARLMAEKALAVISSPDRGPVVTFLLERYFGQDAMANLPGIKAGFAKILNQWKDWDPQFDCELQTSGQCANKDPHKVTIAYVNKHKNLFSANTAHGSVHVCAEAFNTPGDMQELASSLLHELSHRLDNTDDHKYCWESAGWCSDLDAATAVDNADSYAQFARELFNALM